MRGTKAKKIRKKVYGDLSLRQRKYYKDAKSGHVIRDSKRKEYQKAKGRRQCPTDFKIGTTL